MAEADRMNGSEKGGWAEDGTPGGFPSEKYKVEGQRDGDKKEVGKMMRTRGEELGGDKEGGQKWYNGEEDNFGMRKVIWGMGTVRTKKGKGDEVDHRLASAPGHSDLALPITDQSRRRTRVRRQSPRRQCPPYSSCIPPRPRR